MPIFIVVDANSKQRFAIFDDMDYSSDTWIGSTERWHATTKKECAYNE
jgi:hypothetical protein